MAGAVMTSIVLKSGVTLMDIVSTRMLGQFGFLGKVFDVFRANEISVDVVATSEISISLTLDPRCARLRIMCTRQLLMHPTSMDGLQGQLCTHARQHVRRLCTGICHSGWHAGLPDQLLQLARSCLSQSCGGDAGSCGAEAWWMLSWMR